MQDNQNNREDKPGSKGGQQSATREGGDDALENLAATGADLDEDLNIAIDLGKEKSQDNDAQQSKRP
jgi:hypothetical protein